MPFSPQWLVGCLLTLTACSSTSADEFVGRWKRADNREVLEFAEDGTLTKLASVSAGSGRDRQVTVGGTYRVPEEGQLQLTQGPDGPQNMVVQVFGDSMHLTGLDGQRVTYYRDRGDKPSVPYRLSSVDGHPLPHVHQARVPVPSGSSYLMSMEYREGEITLDPLTHTFVETLTAVEQGMVRAGGDWTTTARGRYTQEGNSVTLDFEGSDRQPAKATIRGEVLSYRTMIENPVAREQQFMEGPQLQFTER